MAIKALDIGKTRTYVCKDDDPNDPTTWTIGTLSSRDRGAIRDASTSFNFSQEELEAEDGDAQSKVSTTVAKSKSDREAVRRGVKGWENFIGPDGTPIQFKTVIRDVDGSKRSVIPNDLLDIIPLDTLSELAGEVMGAEPTGDEMGNSPAPSSGE